MGSVPISAQVKQLLSLGRHAEAAKALLQAAEGGDADALFPLAAWRISGQIIRRDTATARELMRRAGEAGHRKAKLLHAHFLANGTGGPSDWRAARTLMEAIAPHDPAAAEQLAMLARMVVGEEGEPRNSVTLRRICEEPRVETANGFVSDEECDYLIRAAEPRLQLSVVTDRATGKSFPHPERRSEGTFFGVTNEDLVVNAINRRIAAASGTTLQQAEPLQVLRYGPGGEFRPHFDSVAEGSNQRIITALLYLTDHYEGGETRFLRADLNFRGRKGDILLFHNVTPDGRADPMAEHAGLPVRSGTKIVASRWIWRDAYRVAPPQPLLSSQ